MTVSEEGVREGADSEGGGDEGGSEEGGSEGRGEGGCEGGWDEGGSEGRREEGVCPPLPAGARRLLEIVNCPVNVFVICLFEVQY